MSNFPLRISDELKNAAKQKAIDEGCSLNLLIEKALAAYINFNFIEMKDDFFKVACCNSRETKIVKDALLKAGVVERPREEVGDSSSFIFVQNGVMRAATYNLFKNLECKEIDFLTITTNY